MTSSESSFQRSKLWTAFADTPSKMVEYSALSSKKLYSTLPWNSVFFIDTFSLNIEKQQFNDLQIVLKFSS